MSDREGLVSTLHSLHIVGEHVMAAARYAATGHIGLTVADGHIATPPFGDDGRTLAIVGTDLMCTDGASVRSAPLLTLREVGALAGVTPGAPAAVYTPATPCDLDAPLELDPTAAAELTEWYALAAAALAEFAREVADEQPSGITLWPEHFDVAIRVGEVNYGGLGGDRTIGSPYLYVGPTGVPVPREPASFWNMPFGATVTWHEVDEVDAAVEFFREGHARLAG